MAMLIILSGLPGSGKSSIARELAQQMAALWLRIDSIEQGILSSGIITRPVEDAGYRVAYALAEDNLRLGRDVIGDSVNGLKVTRDAWRDTGVRSGAQIVELEMICSNLEEHRRRVETRCSEIPGLHLPDWEAVLGRDVEPWDRDHLTVETAGRSIEDCTKEIRAFIEGRTSKKRLMG